MEASKFSVSVNELGQAITAAMEAFFNSRGIVFDKTRFLSETTIEIGTLATEAHLYGADLAPRYESQVLVA